MGSERMAGIDNQGGQGRALYQEYAQLALHEELGSQDDQRHEETSILLSTQRQIQCPYHDRSGEHEGAPQESSGG